MKLAIIMDQYNNPFAGTESQVMKLVEGLKARGWDIRFAVFRETAYTRSGQFPVPVDHLGVGSLSSPGSWIKVYRYARRLKAEGIRLAHVFFNDTSVICPPVMRMAGLRTIISRRDMGFWYNGLYLRALGYTGRFVTAAVCNSQAVAEITGRMEGLPQEKLHVIYNGYPDTEQDYLAGSTRDDSGPLVIGLVANLRPIKRIDDLIRACGRLHQCGYNLELRIAGGGTQDRYRALAEQLGIGHQVTFLGSVSNPEDHIREFDVAVLCSETEGFSNAIIEYMRAGKPVVCTRTGGNPEIVTDGTNGYLVPVGDVDALAEAIRSLIDNPELRKAMGKAALDAMAGKYSMDNMVQQHVSLYGRFAVREARP
ncbi:glycosyltransferase family 4 protein [Marinobacter mobilis]|uniref:Glycosyltransferase involved in cell wall bisynthesis n=1 Tax=Marinobacter mobilis TaxID=488533 RepID=A0A1H2UUS8_9GAMM|nr:glycosyltransferase family 4 protein [Marinobacter mobilis]SDW59880.1 Glycosyltransferase involved in cell wall bisynthesis [Marinobacter mobilis]